MKMTTQQHVANAQLNLAIKSAERAMNVNLRGLSIVEMKYSGSDLRIHLSNGKEFLLSAIESDWDGKPIIDGVLS